MTYSIGEMAKKLGIAASTLRYYDKEGLLPFVQRSEKDIRVFTDSDYAWLQIITCLKQTGMKISDIREYINMAMEGDETIESRLQMFYDQREAVIKQIEQLNLTLEIINYKCWYYETAKEIGNADAVKNLPKEQIPEKYWDVWEHIHKC